MYVLRALLRDRAAHVPESVALYQPSGDVTTFDELQRMADELGRALPAGPSRVAVRITNTPIGIAAAHAVWQRGSSAVLLGPRLPRREVERRLAETGCAAVVDLDGGAPAVRPVASEPAPPAGDEALVVFTSGTTGRPKGALLTTRSIAASVGSIADGVGMSGGRLPTNPPRSPSPTFLPLFHVGGLLGTITAMYLGKPTLIVDRWSVDDVFDLVPRFGLTMLRLAPPMLHDLATAPGDRSLRPVKVISVGSAALSEGLRRRIEERYGVVVLNNYGQTELSGAIAFERYDDVKAGRRPPGTVGRIAPGVEVRVVDADGRDVPAGEPGELWARTPGALEAYVVDGAVVDPRRDGWVTTGDIGSVDAEGFVHLLGRAGDVVVCGGFNVYPAVVEAALARVPGVVDAAVVGVDDERLGEIPVAVVTVEDSCGVDVDRVQLALRDELAPYELPRRLAVVDAVPRTELGKPDRAAIVALVS
jgi:long-chain acyl-CoA synthetase